MDGRYPALAVSPPQKREITLGALLSQIDGAASQEIVFEDAHSIDPTSLDLLDGMVTPNLPGLLIVTLRPEFPAELGRSTACDDAVLEPPWPER